MKEVWSKSWKKILIWACGYVSIIAFAIAGGYAIVKSEDEELKKTAKTCFIVTLVFGYIFSYNEDAIVSSFVGGANVEPFITAAIGLIPNCASSAVLAQTFCEGGIYFGSMTAGLCCNAGLGFVVLLKNTKKIKRNIALIVVLYAISVLVGIAVNSTMAAAGLITF